MKFIRILVFTLFVAPFAANAATSEFMMAAQLLAAAKNADIQQVQALVNNGANINFIDATGVSIVCTALMNNDIRAAQILQMYGADASKCDYQIKRYNNRNKAKGGGGLFSGLSSAQSISLAAAGAAVVVGGLLLLTDVFDPGNDNDAGSSSGNRPGGDGNDDTSSSGTEFVTVPYSPAYLAQDGKITTSDEVYQKNLLGWNPSAGGLRQWDFNYFRPNEQMQNNYLMDGITVPVQNYLLMMHGYSAFANQYFGQGVFRADNDDPLPIKNGANGGAPIKVSVVTGNGVNPVGSLNRADGILYSTSAAADSATYIVDKFLNYNGAMGAEIVGFDLSGSGTAMNPFASSYQTALGKIVAGWDKGGREYGDLMGFVPNAQLGVYRTGDGSVWVDVKNPLDGDVVATLTDSATDGAGNVVEVGDKITIDGKTYVLSYAKDVTVAVRPMISVGGTNYYVDTDGALLLGKCEGDNCQVCDDEENCTSVSDIAMYAGVDGYFYVNTMGGDTIDAVYVLDKDNNFFVQKENQVADYKNFEAIKSAMTKDNAVIANTSVIAPARSVGYTTMSGAKNYISSLGVADATGFISLVNQYYDRDDSDDVTQGAYANNIFSNYGSSNSTSANVPFLVMSAGEFGYGTGVNKTTEILEATFENYAPVIEGYDNLKYNFMTVVAVMHANGTDEADTIEGYGNGTGSSFGPLYLSTWKDSDENFYMSRRCGSAGLRVNGIDPWCFAAAGATAEMATASAAGAIASLKSAFSYMSNRQLFYLMALTADGYLLKTNDAGVAFTTDTLATYLQNMYKLPPSYNEAVLSSEQYLDAFADVYGYGLINLDRAMRPNHNVYVYNGDKIVSEGGNAYWRAAQKTNFKPSSVLNMRGATVKTAFYDVLESQDGSVSLPRVWENEIALGGDGRHALYMGDVLGGLKTRRENAQTTQFGDLSFSMAISERAYKDNLGGLDNLSLGYTTGNWAMVASYQRYLTDNVSRFDGMANPVLGLASNAVVSDATYKSGDWSFGARVFSGAITDEGLLENDPTISSQYMPAKLGLMQGAQTHTTWSNDKFAFTATVGATHETDTLLGAQSNGLLNLGAGDTTYIDAVAKYRVNDVLDFTAHATFARTTSDASSGQFILGMSDINSNAFALGANIGDFEFSVSQPLAIVDGAFQYAYAEYDVIENANGGYELNVVDTHVADVSLCPENREIRFNGTYRHKFGEFTDGAIGFIYRVNPNHTDEYGNESIFMMKLSHRLGV